MLSFDSSLIIPPSLTPNQTNPPNTPPTPLGGVLLQGELRRGRGGAKTHKVERVYLLVGWMGGGGGGGGGLG
jgi:hypothetical protein